MKNQFCSYEIALKLKELGFDEPCLACFTDGEIHFEKPNYLLSQQKANYIFKFRNTILAPLWQQVIDWLKKKHSIFVFIDMGKYYDSYEGAYPFQAWCKIYKNNELINSITVKNKLDNENFIFYSYEEAREQAILKAIELIKK